MKQTTFLIIVLCAAAVLACGQARSQEKEPESEWRQVFPCEADGAPQVRDAGGRNYPSTGPGCNTWLNWGGAGNWKRFSVRKAKPVLIKAWGDSGTGACLGHVSFRLSELAGGEVKKRFDFEGPDWRGKAPIFEPRCRFVYFIPRSEKFEIACIKGGFYVEVFQLFKKKKEGEFAKEERAKVGELIKKLCCDSWKEREKAQRELEKMGEWVLPLLEKEKDNPVFEVRLRVKRIIRALKPAGVPVPEDEMKDDAAGLVEDLLLYIELNSFTCDSEPVRSLAAIGPYALKPLLAEFDADSDSEHVRAAVVLALGKLKNTGGLKTVLSALKSDKSQEVRYQAAVALVSFDTKEVRKALKEASEKDKSERVCKQALESLKQIESRKPEKEKKDE